MSGSVIAHAFTQHPVGQGFFFSAALRDRLDDGVRELRYVYDCGSSSHKKFVTDKGHRIFSQQPPRLDYLFISHLHADHVNAIRALLEDRSVDTIILPFLDDAERLLAYIESSRGTRTHRGVPLDGWYADFISDPAGTLDELDPRRIIFVRGDDGEDFLAFDEPPRTPDDELSRDVRDGQWIEGFIGPQPRPHRDGPRRARSQRLEIGRGSALCAKSRAGTNSWWLFAPYVVLGDCRKAEFLASLGERLDIPNVEQELARPGVLRSLLLNDESFEKLQAAYEDVVGEEELNLTSLCLLSAPLMVAEHTSCSAHAAGLHITAQDRGGWLGTGDADLKTKYRRETFLHYFGRYPGRPFVMSSPHHGSANNFHSQLVDDIRPMVVVASCDYRSYRHPSPKVVTETCAAGALFWVTSYDEESTFTAHEKFYY